MSHKILPWFSAVDFEHDFIISKVELEKNGQNLAMFMNPKIVQNCEPFLKILRISFKTNLQHMFELDCMTYKGVKIFNISFC